MADAMDGASRPSDDGAKKKVKLDTPDARAARVALMAQRYGEGKDIWTGNPLTGRDKREAERVNGGLED